MKELFGKFVLTVEVVCCIRKTQHKSATSHLAEEKLRKAERGAKNVS